MTGGSSVFMAATAVRQKAIKVASEMLEAAEEDLVLEGGKVQVAGVPEMSLTPWRDSGPASGRTRRPDAAWDHAGIGGYCVF